MIEQVEQANTIIRLQDKHVQALEARIQALEAQIAADSEVSELLLATAKILEPDRRPPEPDCRPPESPHGTCRAPDSPPDQLGDPEACSMTIDCTQEYEFVSEEAQPLSLSASLPSVFSQVVLDLPSWSSEETETEEPLTAEYATSEDVEAVCKKSEDLVRALAAVTADCAAEVQQQWVALMRENGGYKDRIERMEQLVSRRAEQLHSGDAELRLCRSIKGLCFGSQQPLRRRWRVS